MAKIWEGQLGAQMAVSKGSKVVIASLFDGENRFKRFEVVDDVKEFQEVLIKVDSFEEMKAKSGINKKKGDKGFLVMLMGPADQKMPLIALQDVSQGQVLTVTIETV